MKNFTEVLRNAGPIFVAVAAGFAGGWCATVTQAVNAQAGSAPKVLKASRLELVNSSGKICGLLSADPAPSIALLNKQGVPIVGIMTGQGGQPLIQLRGNNGAGAATIGIMECGAGIALSGQGEKVRMTLGMGQNGLPGVAMTNLHDKAVVLLSAQEDESGGLVLFDAYGRQKQSF